MTGFRFRTFAQAAVFILALPLAAASFAEPSLKEVYQTAQSGNVKEAESMMREVLAAHPESAKAHYVAAEILAKENKLTEARAEFESAVRLQPDLKFAKPMAVANLQRQLNITTKLPQQSAFAEPWVMWALVIFGVLLVVVAVKIFRRPAMAGNNMAYGANPAMAGGNPQGGYPQGGYPNQPMGGGGMGSGIMGGLATGAAVGAGIVAGEMLMHKVLDGNQPSHGANTPQQDAYAPPVNGDMGGSDFGVADNNSWDSSDSFSSNDSFGGDSGGDWS